MAKALEIIITHWKEPWVICEKLIQTLDIQRGMDGQACGVTFVQDGEDCGDLDLARLARRYPFITRIIRIPHGGISAARNVGMDAADAEFIMFCDCDDMFYSCDSVRKMLNAIRDSQGRADVIWGTMYIESRTAAGKWSLRAMGWNLVFTHAKAWRLSWLRERGIRFQEGIDYSEDSLFNAVAAMELSPGRVRGIQEPIYVWCLRAGSCTSDRANDPRNRAHLARHRILLPQIARERRPQEAAAKAVRGIFDAYYELTGGRVPEDEGEKLAEIYTRELILPWEAEIAGMDPEERRQIMAASREHAVREHGFREETILFGDWIKEMKRTHGEAATDDSAERGKPDAGDQAESGRGQRDDGGAEQLRHGAGGARGA